MATLSIAKDFSKTPGARFARDGTNSGEEFRKKHLEPLFESQTEEKIIIDLDGVEGYSTAFLEEAFGGLARVFGRDAVLAKLEFVSEEEPLLIEEIRRYITGAETTR
jgi:STAS-like domain of unknown function (DUF4325)